MNSRYPSDLTDAEGFVELRFSTYTGVGHFEVHCLARLWSFECKSGDSVGRQFFDQKDLPIPMLPPELVPLKA